MKLNSKILTIPKKYMKKGGIMKDKTQKCMCGSVVYKKGSIDKINKNVSK
jgi:hypothetical protein